MKPADHGQSHTFKLQKGQSAGDALTAWVTGLTISDFNAIRMAQDLLELKDDMGWQAFDKMFGSSDMADDAAIPEDHRLIISSQVHQTLWVENMRALAFANPEPLSEPASLEARASRLSFSRGALCRRRQSPARRAAPRVVARRVSDPARLDEGPTDADLRWRRRPGRHGPAVRGRARRDDRVG
jgi:hypothetical protein